MDMSKIKGVQTLVPKAHHVKALEYTGQNFADVSLFVPHQFRAYIESAEKSTLMVQTCDGCEVVMPGMTILFGRVGPKIGYHVLTAKEMESYNVIETEPKPVVPERGKNWPFPTGNVPKPSEMTMG